MSGAFRLGEILSSRNLLVLTYHRVIPRDLCPGGRRPPNTLFTDEFDSQMAFVARRFRVLTGEELLAFIQGKDSLPWYSLAITFDDGYENNYTHALPILQKYGLHAVFFLTTHLIGQNSQSFWFDRLDRLLSVVPLAEIRERLSQLVPSLPVTLGTSVQGCFKTLSSARQLELLDSLEREFSDARIPVFNRTVHGLMSWDQVRSMVSAGMTIGSHTANHQILAAVTPEEAYKELLSSRLRIERETGQTCWCFAYPNGKRQDFRPSDELTVKGVGYLCAFTQISGSINSHTPRYVLRRIAIPDTGDMKIFRSHVSGVQRAFRTVFPEKVG